MITAVMVLTNHRWWLNYNEFLFIQEILKEEPHSDEIRCVAVIRKVIKIRDNDVERTATYVVSEWKHRNKPFFKNSKLRKNF